MDLSDMRFPRQLEIDYDPEVIRQALMGRTGKLWSGGDLDIPMIRMSDLLNKALQKAMVEGHIRCGFEAASDRLKNERAGITHARERDGVFHGERISRLILVSNDGTERLYWHVEQLIRSHMPRLLGCLLDMDGSALGRLINGRERQTKVVLMEHKDAVSEALRAIIDGYQSTG